MSDIWEEIRSDYNKAKDSLWCQKKAGDWRRDDEAGHYYMWKAYHKACEAEPKDELLFARILAMMADESRISVFDYARYHKYVKPSLEAYERAVAAGQRPTEKELETIRFFADSMAYVLQQEDVSYDEQVSRIQGYEQLEDFSFHDSKPVWFEQTDQTARLKLQYGEMTVTFRFEEIEDFQAEGDPLTNWIMDFYCYPCFRRKVLTFDVGYYRIICKRVSVETVEYSKEENIRIIAAR